MALVISRDWRFSWSFRARSPARDAGVADGLLAVIDQNARPAQRVGGLVGCRGADEGVAVGVADLLPQLRDALEGHLLQGYLHQLFQHGKIRRRGKPVPGNTDIPAAPVQCLADGDGVIDVADGDLHQRVVVVGGEPGGVAGAGHKHAAPQLPGLLHAGVLILQIAVHQHVFHIVVRQAVDDLPGHFAELGIAQKTDLIGSFGLFLQFFHGACLLWRGFRR